MFYYATTVLNLDARSVLSIFQFAEMYGIYFSVLSFEEFQTNQIFGWNGSVVSENHIEMWKRLWTDVRCQMMNKAQAMVNTLSDT
jgi:hypothetical protein